MKILAVNSKAHSAYTYKAGKLYTFKGKHDVLIKQPQEKEELDIPLELWRGLLGGNRSNSCTDYGHLIDGHIVSGNLKPDIVFPKISDTTYTGDDAWRNTKEDYKDYYYSLYYTCFDENGNLNPEFDGYFHGKVFMIKDKNNKKALQTIPQFLRSNIKRNLPEDSSYYTKNKTKFYHGTDFEEQADEIIRKGIDFSKLSRFQFGPGFYLASSEGQARNYGSSVLIFTLDSDRSGHVDTKYYEKIKNSNISNQIIEDIGLEKSDDPNINEIQQAIMDKVVNEFSRNYITRAMRMDYLTCPVGLVVLNGSKVICHGTTDDNFSQ